MTRLTENQISSELPLGHIIHCFNLLCFTSTLKYFPLKSKTESMLLCISIVNLVFCYFG